MRAGPVLAVVGIAAVVGGVAAYAYAKKDEDDILDQPQPPELDSCYTAAEVVASANEVLLDSAATATELENAAVVLDYEGLYCDEAARVAGKSSSAALRARAATLNATPPGKTPEPMPDIPAEDMPSILMVPPSPIQIPGWMYYQGHGWCAPGAVLDLETGLCDFSPVKISKSAVKSAVKTSGKGCCSSCANGGECEGCS